MRATYNFFFFATFITCSFLSCSFSDPEIAPKLKDRKQTIDRNIADGTCASHSVAVLNHNQDIDRYYQLFHDKAKSLMKASETYTCKKGTSDTIFVYYFDENEYTFAFQVKIATGSDSLFNSVTAFYNKDMEMIMKEYAMIDNCDLLIDGTDSLSIDLTAYNIPPDVTTFAQTKKIILQSD